MSAVSKVKFIRSESSGDGDSRELEPGALVRSIDERLQPAYLRYTSVITPRDDVAIHEEQDDMAAMMTSPPNKESLASRPSPLPSRNPLPLSSSQESQVRELYHKRVRNKCADEVRDFAACCTSRTFTATIMCRKEQKAMNTCMMKYATQAEQDLAREEWFATMDKRREERDKKEEKRKQDEVFWREWWDKNPNTTPGQGPPRP